MFRVLSPFHRRAAVSLQKLKVERLARQKSRVFEDWARGFIFPPKAWELGRNLAHREIFKNKSLQLPDHPTPFSEIMFPRGPKVIWVPIQKIVSSKGQAFSSEQHHFVRYLKSGLDEFETFYRIHQPKTALQAHFIYETFPDQPPTKGLDVPWHHADLTKTVTPVRFPEQFGPVSALELSVEALRLDNLQRSFLRSGFLKELESSLRGKTITSRLLLHTNGDFRVMILQGNHRTAVLAHLGWEQIPTQLVGSVWNLPPVRLGDLEQWPGVVDGRFTRETARAIFEAFFRPRHETLLPEW